MRGGRARGTIRQAGCPLHPHRNWVGCTRIVHELPTKASTPGSRGACPSRGWQAIHHCGRGKPRGYRKSNWGHPLARLWFTERCDLRRGRGEPTG